jgi:pentatricopeptide repeat protein
MDERGVRPDVYTYSAAIAACARGSQARAAVTLLREMDGRGINPNAASYSSAQAACATAASNHQGSLLGKQQQQQQQPHRAAVVVALRREIEGRARARLRDSAVSSAAAGLDKERPPALGASAPRR